MKKFLFLIFLLFFAYTANAQCNPEPFKEACIKKVPEFFVFTKSYALDKQESEHEMIFNKQKAYIFIADSYRIKIEVLREENGKKVLLKSDHAYLSYVPPVTGKYLIRFTFEETDEFCGAVVMAFLR